MKDKRYTFGVDNTFAAWTQAELCLFNDRIRRSIALPGTSGSCFTREYCPAAGKYDIIQPVNREFSFTVDKHEYTGADGWDLEKVDYAADQDGGCGAAVWLSSRDGLVGVRLVYLLYPNQDIVRKSLQITNRSEQTAALENVTVENLSVDPYWVTTFSWLYTDYGRRKVIGPYHGTMQDALVILYHPDWCQGIAVGNEAPGVTKQTNFFCGKPEITAGLSTAEGSYPVRKWLEPQQGFEAPQIFTLVFNEQEDTSAVLNQKIPQFVREHMGIRLSALKEKPTFLYNTWVPFKKDIYEKMMYELIDAAAETGIKEFVIDATFEDMCKKDFCLWEHKILQ